MKKNSIVAFGDLNVDWTVRENLALSWPDLIENGVTVLQEILEFPGGGAFTFARTALNAGKSVAVVGAVGQDVAGAWISDRIIEIGATPLISSIPDKPTGRCFIARDRNDVRLLINSLENANHYLSIDQLEVVREKILDSSVVHVPGFCLRDSTKPRYQAVKRIFDWIEDHRNPPVLVFDVVPHRIYELMTWNEFMAICRTVHVLISEVATIRRFFSLGNQHELIDLEKATETLQRLKPHFPCVVLRFGPSGCDEELRWDASNDKTQHVADTGHGSAADKRGVGDRMTIDALQRFFGFI